MTAEDAVVPDHEDVPEELREREQWLMWDASADAPRRPHWQGNFGVSWNDPDDWHTFDEAIEAASERDSWGVGYVFAKANEDAPRGIYGALDLDGCADGDGSPKDWLPGLAQFIDRDAYIEWSPSGDGLHIPLAGFEPPEWWSDAHLTDAEHEGVEAYSSKFFTVTGNQERGSGETVANAGEWVEDWLAEAYESITGEDPRASPFSERETQGKSGGSADRWDSDDWLTEDHIRDALDHIDPDLPYDDWRDIGFALQDEFGDATAERLFKEWSRGGSKWDSEAEDIAERIIADADQGGERTIATVIYYAKSGGWSGPSRTTADGGTAVQSGDVESGDQTDDQTDDGDPWTEVRGAYRSDEDNGPAHSEATRLLRDAFPALTERETEAMLAYDHSEGVFESDGEMVLQRHLVERLGDEYRASRQREIIARVQGLTETPIDEIGGPEELLCVSNGVLDLSELPSGDPDLREHDPEFRFRRAVNAAFDPDADCPRFKQFLGEVVRPEDIDTLQEYAGYTLMHWDQPYKRAALLLGPKDSGKSTFLDIIVAMLDERNVSSENLDALVNSRWGVAETYRKFANVTNELDTNALQSLGKFKTLVGGDALLTAERKGENKFQFHPTAKHMFAANRVPPAQDADDAFHERWLHVLFPRTIPKSEQVKGLDQQIIENELPGVLNWAIEGYRRLVEQDGFSYDPLVGEKRDQWESYGDSVKRFKHNCLNVTGDPDDVIVKEVGHAFYTAFCEWAGAVAESKAQLTRDLKSDAKIDDARRKAHPEDKQRTAYVGVRFDEGALDELDFDPGQRLDRVRGEGEDDEPEIWRRYDGLKDFTE
jgi:putative DNA primase/helicase